MAGRRSREAKDRLGVCLVDVFVTPARDQEASAGRDNDVFCEQRSPLKSRATIEGEIVACTIGKKDNLGRGRIDGPHRLIGHERWTGIEAWPVPRHAERLS